MEGMLAAEVNARKNLTCTYICAPTLYLAKTYNYLQLEMLEPFGTTLRSLKLLTSSPSLGVSTLVLFVLSLAVAVECL